MEQDSYNKMQRGKTDDLDKVKENLSFKRDKKLTTTLGVQCLLMPDNVGQLSYMAKSLRDISVDYLTIKPYS